MSPEKMKTIDKVFTDQSSAQKKENEDLKVEISTVQKQGHDKMEKLLADLRVFAATTRTQIEHLKSSGTGTTGGGEGSGESGRRNGGMNRKLTEASKLEEKATREQFKQWIDCVDIDLENNLDM